MDENDTDDWDNVPPPQSRSDRIQRITSPEGTLQRPHHDHQGMLPYHPGSTSSLARAAQHQQMQLAAALLQQQQMAMLLDQHQPMPGNLASLRRQAQFMSLQAAHNNSLSRPPLSAQQLYNVPVSPAMSHRILPQQSQRFRGGPSSLPPTNGQTLRPVHEALSPNMSSSGRRFSQRHEVQLEPRQLNSLSRRAAHASSSGYWGQADSVAGLKGPFDPFVGSSASLQQQQAMYSGDGSTSSYARINPHNRQTYPPSQQSALSQNAEHGGYALHHDENTSLTSQKTSRTQASMLTKSAPTPSGSGSGASASGSTPQKQSLSEATTASTAVSASAKYAEYITNLQKYQHPPPSKRHVTFIKYRGRQCTIGMLIVFAILVIGLVVAPVVYFTAFANRGQSTASAPQTQLTNMISGQMTLDTTHGVYADLMTDPGRPPDEALKRVQRDMQDLLKEVVQGAGGFAADDINSITVPMPQRPDAHQIFLRFQVSLKNSVPLDVAESKTSKAFAEATNSDLVGIRLKGIPIVTNSLFFRALPLNNVSSSTASSVNNEVMVDAQPDNASRMKAELMQVEPMGSVPRGVSGQSTSSSSSSVSASPTTDKQTVAVTTALTTTVTTQSPSTLPFTTSKPTTAQQLVITAASQQVPASDLPDETFGVGVGVGSKGKKTTSTFPSSSTTLGATTYSNSILSTSAFTFAMTTPRPSTHQAIVTKNSDSLGPAINQLQNPAPPFVPFSFESNHPSSIPDLHSPQGVGHVSVISSGAFTHPPDFIQLQPNNFPSPAVNVMSNVYNNPQATFSSSNLPMTTEWHSFDTAMSPFNTRQPPMPPHQPQSQAPQFVTLVNPNLNGQSQPAQGNTFTLNMQNQPTDQLYNQFSGPNQPSPDSFHPLQPDFNSRNTPFNRGHETAFGNGFSLNGPLPPLSNTNGAPNAFVPQGSFQLNHFSADDASASTTVIDAVKPTNSIPVGHTESSLRNTTVQTVVAAATTPSSVFNMDDFDADFITSTQRPTTVRKTTTTHKVMRTTRRPTTKSTTTEWPITEYEFDFTENTTAPVLISSWGNWSGWGACSAPQCTRDGLQSRTRVCLTSVSGSPQVADADAVCAMNGGQPIEVRSCVCEATTTDLPSEDLSATEPSLDETLLDTSTSTPAVIFFATTTTMSAPEEKVAWSDWSNWSTCSIQPCHANGMQTRHRSCLSNGQPVPDQACFNLEGTSVDTQPCDCPVVIVSTEEPVTAVTTPTFVRTGGQFLMDAPRQPQRPLSLQVQNRPIQRRPSTTIPRTCSALEKPCNNGQCILSYRICDGFPDCTDGSDEPLGCGRCFSGEFKCTNGRCISETLVCDGTDNCGDGSDEFFC